MGFAFVDFFSVVLALGDALAFLSVGFVVVEEGFLVGFFSFFLLSATSSFFSGSFESTLTLITHVQASEPDAYLVAQNKLTQMQRLLETEKIDLLFRYFFIFFFIPEEVKVIIDLCA